MKFLYTFIGTIVAIAIAAYLLPGVTIATWESAVIVSFSKQGWGSFSLYRTLYLRRRLS
jgi:hypothetical protein